MSRGLGDVYKRQKYNPEDIVAITKTADGKLVWLENGTDTAGLNHIITEHADDFLNKGITQEQIPDYVMNALENGKIVGYQGRGTGRPIYEFTYNGEIHKVAITVGNNGKTLYANKVGAPLIKYPVVTINASTLEYNADNATNEWAKDILNYADHNELADKQTFTAKIQINAANCDYVPFALSNNTFFAKFLRPVSVADPHETNFLDGETGGSKAMLKLTFTDWRDHNFDNTAVTKGENYYEYYGIKSISCLEDQIRTDMNSTSCLLYTSDAADD